MSSRIRFSVVADRYSETAHREAEWPALVAWLEGVARDADQGKEGIALVPACMGEGPSETASKDGRRQIGDVGRWRQGFLVEDVQLLGLDFDKDVPGDWPKRIAEALSGWTYCAWTTHSHGRPGKGARFRVLMPLSEPVSRERYRVLVAWWHERLAEHGLVADVSCKDATRVFYLPRTKAADAELEPLFASFGGEPFFVGCVPEPEPVERRERTDMAPRAGSGGNLIEAFCRAFSVEEVLESSGLYERIGDRYRRIGSTEGPGVVLLDCRERPGCLVAWSHHGECRLAATGKPIDAYGAMRELFCDGDEEGAADYARAQLGWPSRQETAHRREERETLDHDIGHGLATWHGSALAEHAQPEVLNTEARPRAALTLIEGKGEEDEDRRIAVPRQGCYAMGDIEERDAWRVRLEERLEALSPEWGDWVAYVRSQSTRLQPGLCVGGAVALGSILASRRWAITGLTSPLYVIAVGRSGSGKGAALGCLGEVINLAWPELNAAGSMSSHQAGWEMIRDASQAGRGLIMIIDEYEAQLSQMLDPRGGAHQKGWRSLLLQLATAGTRTIRMGQSLIRGGGTSSAQTPCLTIYGTATPAALFRSLGRAAVEDGLIPRHLVTSAMSQEPERQRPTRDTPMPEGLRHAVRAHREAHAAWVLQHRSEGDFSGTGFGYPGGEEVSVESTAEDILEGLADDVDAWTRRYGDEGGVPDAVRARTAEQARRVAMALGTMATGAQDAGGCLVTAAVAHLACDIVRLGAADLAEMMTMHLHESQHAEQRARVCAALERLGKGRKGRWVTRSQLLAGVRTLKARDLDEVLATLEYAGAVERQGVAAHSDKREREYTRTLYRTT